MKLRECADDLAASVARGRRILEQAGLSADDARCDAGLLARWVLGWDAATWLLRSREACPDDFDSRFARAIERRARREPLAYIVGEREFYGRSFLVGPDVLIPRPETEFVVDAALAALAAGDASDAVPKPPAIIDVGTGSGCLAITLALERPDARVMATDISERALAVAESNARRLGAADRVTFMHGSFFAQIAGPVDLIVANPPYIAEPERGWLPIEVERFEPAQALFGGHDGLDTIRALLPLVSKVLADARWFVMEIGQGQLAAVRDLVERTPGLAFDHCRSDLQGIPRVVVVRRAELH
jgi:release factor glutamine methyltransferase